MDVVLINVIRIVLQVVTLVVLAKVILSYFMSPYHPVRETIDRVVEPMLAPIRRVVPPMGMIDFSPIVLIILLQILGTILMNLVAAIF